MKNRVKNQRWLGAVLSVCMLLMNACSSEEALDTQDIGSPSNDQTLVINLATSGDRLTTRAGRPLYSAEPDQLVQQLSLYVFDQTTKALKVQKELSKSVIEQASDYKWGKQLLISFHASEGDYLQEGTYTCYALAFSDATGYEWQMTGHRTLDEFEQHFAAVLKPGKFDAEEVFAGKAVIQAKVVDGKKGKTTILVNQGATPTSGRQEAVVVLNRQVAGAIGYFTNIPCKVNGWIPTAVRLIASNKNNRVNFIKLLQGETLSETDPNHQITYVVNGLVQGNPKFPTVEYNEYANVPGYTVYEIQLADFFPWMKQGKTFADCDLNGDGCVGAADVDQFKLLHPGKPVSEFWVEPDASRQKLLPGSVYGANFVIPFRWKEACPTFELQLVGNNEVGAEVYLRGWKVRIKDAQVNKDKPNGSTSTGVVVEIVGDKSTSIFNVYRNHMYALGKKTSNMGTDTDEPLDLSRIIEMIISIHKQWGGSESMGIN